MKERLLKLNPFALGLAAAPTAYGFIWSEFDIGCSMFSVRCLLLLSSKKTPNTERPTPNAECRKELAGEGNRTLVSSLGSWRSTIELHPRRNV